MRLRLRVDYASRVPAPSRAAIGRWARAALGDWRRPSVSLGVRVVNRAESARLNTRYRGRRTPTNVLAFAFAPPAGVRVDTLGDLVICAPVVNREATDHGKEVKAHWAHMVVHGILHLRGYDHHTRAEASLMERREAAVLRRLGFSDPYS
ncbi:MAG TPA: rRNA maturation RNase YbeY [Burkholderiales bacterium]|nr:rRNA maturation RNase YbeY [Burkholderiales bacterium]